MKKKTQQAENLFPNSCFAVPRWFITTCATQVRNTVSISKTKPEVCVWYVSGPLVIISQGPPQTCCILKNGHFGLLCEPEPAGPLNPRWNWLADFHVILQNGDFFWSLKRLKNPAPLPRSQHQWDEETKTGGMEEEGTVERGEAKDLGGNTQTDGSHHCCSAEGQGFVSVKFSVLRPNSRSDWPWKRLLHSGWLSPQHSAQEAGSLETSLSVIDEQRQLISLQPHSL